MNLVCVFSFFHANVVGLCLLAIESFEIFLELTDTSHWHVGLVRLKSVQVEIYQKYIQHKKYIKKSWFSFYRMFLSNKSNRWKQWFLRNDLSEWGQFDSISLISQWNLWKPCGRVIKFKIWLEMEEGRIRLLAISWCRINS